jgi:carbon monoxide dehydrogenase subunit G
MSRPPPKRRRAPSHPVTKRELQENNPSIAEAVTKRLSNLKNLAITITAIAGAAYVAIQVWSWSGARWLVSDHTLDLAIGTVKKDFNAKIDDTKDEVVKNQNQIKGEITGSLGDLNKTLNSVARNQSAAAMDQADVQMRLAFTQKQTLQGQLAVVNQSLVKDTNDQLALTRKMQLEDFIKQNDTYMQDAQQKMTRLRNNN